jgi:hypothetical protein
VSKKQHLVDRSSGLSFGHFSPRTHGSKEGAIMSELNETEIRALDEALDDEYRAWATYNQVIHDFGEVPPFTNILGAEERHIDALHSLFVRYGLPVPDNSWPERIPHYTSVSEACQAGVAAEIANGRMYDRLLTATGREDIVRVLRNLRDASQQRHLPAFQRCVERQADATGGHPGMRQRRRRGRERT